MKTEPNTAEYPTTLSIISLVLGKYLQKNFND